MHLIVVGEGATEEVFTRNVLRPHLENRGIRVEPRLIDTSQGARGGALSRDRVIRALRNTLRENGRTYVTTFFDLYGLRPDFPGFEESRTRNAREQKCVLIEAALAQVVVEASGCRASRFLPHIQPYEFEGMLFSDVRAFIAVQPEWHRFGHDLQRVRDEAETPEHINDGPDTHPSARLAVLREPRYKKQLHGSRIAERIGLARIRTECPHFGAWLTKVETLPRL